MGAAEFDEAVRDEVTGWIDRCVIAEEILVCLEEAGVEQTVENAKKVWLNVLQNGLPDDCRYAIDAIKAGWKPD